MLNSAPQPGSEEEWEALLRQLRQPATGSPSPFFYARVRARLESQANRPFSWLPPWLRRPAYAALLGLLILAVSGDGAAAVHSHADHPASYVLP